MVKNCLLGAGQQNCFKNKISQFSHFIQLNIQKYDQENGGNKCDDDDDDKLTMMIMNS